MNGQMVAHPKIHLRKPIASLRIGYCGPEPVREEETCSREDAAYRRGRSEAEEIANRQILQARADMEQLQNKVLAAIQSRYDEMTSQFDGQMPELVMSIVGKVWEGIVPDRDMVLKAIDAALAQVGGNTDKLVVRLCPQDAALLRNPESFQNRFPDLVVETDPELKPGDVMLHSRFGVVDCRIATKLHRVESEIRKAHE